jgi:hypothetical protein
MRTAALSAMGGAGAVERAQVDVVLRLRVGQVGWHHADVSSYPRRFTSPRLAGGRCAAT